ncbi:MAG: hypothetical protein R2754_08990 [Microthrixaceae bacterium]
MFSTVGAEPRSSWTTPGDTVIPNPSVDPSARSWADPDAVPGVLGPPEANPTDGALGAPQAPIPFWEPRSTSSPAVGSGPPAGGGLRGHAAPTGTHHLGGSGVLAKLRDGETGPMDLARDPLVRMAAALVAVVVAVLLIGRLGDLVSPSAPAGAGLGIGAPAPAAPPANPAITADTPPLGDDGKPPQLVMVAVGGDLSAERVRRWQTVADQQAARVTFLPAATDLLGPVGADQFRPTGAEPGTAPEGFAGPTNDEARTQVTGLVDALDSARANGHETSGRLGGEFCGPDGTAAWTGEQWAAELGQFVSVAAHYAEYNAWGTAPDLFEAHPLAGAYPACGRADPGALARAVGSQGLRWLAGVGPATDDGWPINEGGVWRFPATDLAAPGAAQGSAAASPSFVDAAASEAPPPARNELLDAALARLDASLAGDRAPLSLGALPRGAQPDEAEEALVSFVEQACGRAEVRCVTFSEAADYLAANRG